MSLPQDPLVPLLWRACLAGDVKLMDELMVRGAGAHVRDRNGENCLHMTARSGEVDAFEKMVNQGLDVNTANHNGQTALHVAVTKDHLAIVRYIIRHGGDPDITTKSSGMTGLHLACKDNNEEVIKFLLENGANCAIKDKIKQYADYYTANKTILAIFEDHFDVCTHGRGRVRGQQHSGGTSQTSYLADGIDTHTDLAHLYKTPSASLARDSSGKAVINDEEEIVKAKDKRTEDSQGRGAGDQRHGRDRDGAEMAQWQHGDVSIHDKMETYDADGDKHNYGFDKKDGKKVKLNHKMDFSEQHKKRMQQNVFDRLLGGQAKKGTDNKKSDNSKTKPK